MGQVVVARNDTPLSVLAVSCRVVLSFSLMFYFNPYKLVDHIYTYLYIVWSCHVMYSFHPRRTGIIGVTKSSYIHVHVYIYLGDYTPASA